MKTIIAIFCAMTLGITAAAQGSITYEKADSIRVEALLSEAASMPRGTSPVLYFARRYLGVPYVAHTLEANSTEQLVVNTRQMDCLTLVENATALALCHYKGLATFRDFCRELQRLRYRGGIIDGYPSRLHYFSEWITDNEALGIVRCIENASAPFTAEGMTDVWFMGKNPDKYKMLKGKADDIKKIQDMEKRVSGASFRYIPKSAIRNSSLLRSIVHDGDILAIVTSLSGLDIAHVGIAAWHKDGLHLLNASSIHHKVVEEPMTLYQYMQKHPSQKGIRVVRVIAAVGSSKN